MSFETRVGRHIRFIPERSADVAIGIGLLLLGDLVILYGGLPRLQVFLGIPVLLLLPGYALLLVFFPRRQSTDVVLPETDSRTAFSTRSRGIGLRERAALSFGLSVVLIPPTALVLSGLGVGLTIYSILAAVNALVLVGFVVGERRRRRLDDSEQFILPVGRWLSDAQTAVFGANSTATGVVNALLIVTVVVAMSGVTYAVFTPQSGETYTDFSLLTKNDAGDFVSSGYPSTLTVGESQTLFVGVDNHERERTSYTVVVELQRVRTTDGSVTVLERERLGTFNKVLAPEQSWREQHTVTPTMTGEDLRLVYFLYTGDAPTKPNAVTAYQTLYLWITVEDPEPTPAAMSAPAV